MELSAKVREILKSKVFAQVQPVAERVADLKLSLDEHLNQYSCHQEQQVLEALLGATPKTYNWDGLATLVADFIGFLDSVSEADEPILTPSLPPPSLDRVETLTVEAEWRRLDAAIQELSQSVARDPSIRALKVVQLRTAEVRLCMETVPIDHPIQTQLGHMIRVLGGIKHDLQSHGHDMFIRGLKRDHQADWKLVAERAQREVDMYDADTEVSDVVLSKSGSVVIERKRRPAQAGVREEPEHHDPANLRTSLGGKKIILLGGKDDFFMLELLRKRYNLTFEWDALEENQTAKYNALLKKYAAAANIGACLFLNSYFSHKFSKLPETLKESGVPVVNVGKGGFVQINGGLKTLDELAQQQAVA